MGADKFKQQFDKIDYFRWSSLRQIQNNKIIRSSYVWFLIVPVAAKLFHKIEGPLSFAIDGKVFSLDLALPFSWKMFFFSALCFSVGNLIYIARAEDDKYFNRIICSKLYNSPII